MWLVFFFQAEDGIRGHCVTGVQTCALPIFMSCGRMENRVLPYVDGRLKEGERRDVEKHLATCAACRLRVRSEERRVGKECRSRRPAEQSLEESGEDTVYSQIPDRVSTCVQA